MTDSKSGSDSESPPIELESPPASEVPNMALVDFFPEDSLAFITAKFTMVDTLLRLSTRDCKFSEFMRESLLTLMRVVKSEAGSIIEINHDERTMFFRAIVGQSSDRLSGVTIPIGQGIVGHVAESRQPLVVTNMDESKIHLKAIQNAVGFETRNLVAVPVSVRGHTFCVIELLNRVGESTFTRNDLDLLDYFCEVFGKTIEARLMISWQKKHGPKGESGHSEGSAA